MSEYQYYEFQALDRPLTQREMRELRKYPTRATITDTRFVNHYEWGNFKGDASKWMRKYFDAFLHCANWGTHRLMLRLPSPALDIKTAKRYLGGRSISAHRKDNIVILDFAAEDESGNWGADYDGTGLLSSLVALRADIAAGDHRALYLAWRSSAQSGNLDDDETEPPVPPGMATLSAPLKVLADFLYVSADLIQVAAARSEPMDKQVARRRLERWVAALPDSEKSALLYRFATEEGRGARADLLQRFRNASRVSRPTTVEKSRTVGALLDEAERRAHQAAKRGGKRDR
jgi:hypothetical protein